MEECRPQPSCPSTTEPTAKSRSSGTVHHAVRRDGRVALRRKLTPSGAKATTRPATSTTEAHVLPLRTPTMRPDISASAMAGNRRRVPDRKQILVLVARGLSNTDITTHLTLSVATVKSHIGRLLTKLNARDRAQLVVVAYETGLVTASPTDLSA
jgi:DNA-binding NarL/FixJ family response regulator